VLRCVLHGYRVPKTCESRVGVGSVARICGVFKSER
jgi:hypothetical protein